MKSGRGQKLTLKSHRKIHNSVSENIKPIHETFSHQPLDFTSEVTASPIAM